MLHPNSLSPLKNQFQNNLPFVVYRKPNEPGRVLALLQKNKLLYSTPDLTKAGFIFTPFDASRGNVLIPLEASDKLQLESLGAFEEVANGNDSISQDSSQSEMRPGNTAARQKHLELVEKGIHALQEGGMEKVVLSRKERVQLQDEDPFNLFQDLLVSYPSAFVYLWYHPEIGVWIGATPETLLEVEGLHFKTMSLAGTQKFSGNLDVGWGSKEIQEQQYVTDSILDNLKALEAVNQVNAGQVFTSRAGNLLHLRSDISGSLETMENLREIVMAIHPTPAVCGLPKLSAQDFILKNEGYDREYYTGFLGELNFPEVKSRSRNRRNTENLAYTTIKKKTSLFVNLRCMKVLGSEAELFIGGGITRDSDPESEWEETVNKSHTLKKVILK